MADARSGRRKFFRWLLGLIVLAFIVVVLLPVWFPWLLSPVLRHYGIRFNSYDRISYTRFTIGDVDGQWKNTHLHAKQIECVLPTAWFWNKVFPNTNRSSSLIVSNADLLISETESTEKNRGSKKIDSLAEVIDQVARVGTLVSRIVPSAELTNGSIQIRSNIFSLPMAEWRMGRLRAKAVLPKVGKTLELTSGIQGKNELSFSATAAALETSIAGKLTRNNEGWRLTGQAQWLTNHAEFFALFSTNGWWPAHAQVNIPGLNVPAEQVRLKGWEDFQTSLTANIISNQFTLQATGFARPAAEFVEQGFSEVNFTLGAAGDPHRFNLRELHVRSPWLTADLENEFGITRTGELLADPAQLRVNLDLEKFPGTNLTGKISGLVRVVPRGWQPPVARFDVSAESLHAWQVDMEKMVFRGEYESRTLRLHEVAGDFSDGSTFAASGSFSFDARETDGQWELSGPILRRYLTNLNYANLSASGIVTGPLTNLTHQGRAHFVNLQMSGLKPLGADISWEAQQLNFKALHVELAAGASVLALESQVDLNSIKESRINIALQDLSLNQQKEKIFSLQNPSTILVSAIETNSGQRNWTVDVSDFDWRGADRVIALSAQISWPERGVASVTLTNIALTNFSDFIASPIPNVMIAAFGAQASWTNGPIHSQVAVEAAMTNRTGERVALRSAFRSGDVLEISRFEVESGYAPALTMSGTVPVAVIPGHEAGPLILNETREIDLIGSLTDQQLKDFSIPLPTLGELKISRPQLRIQGSGNIEKPAVALHVSAASIRLDSATNDFIQPTLEEFQIDAELHPQLIKLAGLKMKLDGQLIQASGEWPLPIGAWNRALSARSIPDWSQAHGRFLIENADVAALSRYLPQSLAPEGQVSLNLELSPEKKLAGRLSLTNAATRPLGKITPLRDIAAEIRLNGRRAELQSFSGQVGGAPVEADGYVVIPEDQGALDYQVNLRGTNVPLARSLQLLLRGDFALQLRGGSNGPPLVSGLVNLHDGLFVQHASALIWRGPKRPELRPPYFSITNEPFAGWKLDLALTGEEFLRVRTPVFSGSLSANLKVGGIFRTPILTGDARATSGRVLFPFGTLNLNQGFISFSGSDPRGPDVQINASGRNYGYDLRLEVSGPADGANVIFSSTPPLTSEEILLMLTAGEVPRQDYTFTGTDRAQRLATFLGRDLLRRFMGSGTGEERLVIRTGEGISEEGRLTYSVEYRLSDRWSVIGEYDEFNAFNADLKWKLFTR